MAELGDVISISEISEKIIERISDKKLLQLHTGNLIFLLCEVFYVMMLRF